MENELITVTECRNLRETINVLTQFPIITKEEYEQYMKISLQVLDRLEVEE